MGSSDPGTGLDTLLTIKTTDPNSVPFNASTNRWAPVAPAQAYDAAGNLTDVQVNPDSFHGEYDGENRLVATTTVVNPVTKTVQYVYDGEGRRVKKVTGGAATYYVYDASGQLAMESGANITSDGTQYLTADQLGSARLTTTGTAAVTMRSDYVPFGQEIPAGWGRGNYQADATETVKFTGKERDSETGLDYFGARYFSGAQGRFTSPDPSMLSTVMANPQSWNRYSYALNNPLRYVDPNGELWVSSGDANNPYSWVDQCGEKQTCYQSVAAVVGNNLRVYGSENAQAITNYAANANGLINVATLSNNADANFESIQTRGREENYLGLSQAAALFNVAGAYGQKYPNDDYLVFTGGSTATGGSALDANGNPIHQSHRNGANIDLRYMGDDGTALSGRTAAGSGNVERNEYIISQFAGQNANVGAALTGDPARYGLGPIPAGLQQIHQNHMHFQQNYPAPPRQEPRIRPGQR